MNSAKAAANLANVEKLAARCTVLDARDGTATKYAETRLQLKVAGTPIPENDIWIAAICLEHGLALATADKHFKSVKGLKLSTTPKT